MSRLAHAVIRPLRSNCQRAAIKTIFATCFAGLATLGLGDSFPAPRRIAAEDFLRRLDGARFAGRVASIDPAGAIRFTVPPTRLLSTTTVATTAAKIDLDSSRLDDLLAIRFEPPNVDAAPKPPTASPTDPATASPTTPPMRIVLRDGSLLHAGSVRLENERLELTGGLFRGVISIGIDAAARLEWAAADALPPASELLWRPSADQDRLLVRDGNAFRAVPGIIERIDSEQVTIDVDGEQRKLPRARVAAVVFAAPALPTTTPAGRELRLVDGSRWHVSQVTLDERGWRAKMADVRLVASNPGGDDEPSDFVELPRAVVEELLVRSPRLRWLAELPPREVVQRNWLAWPLPWGRDRAVAGGPLRMDGVVYSQGLGTQAGTRLTFELPSGAVWFAATVGLDDAARERGDCFAVVHGDATAGDNGGVQDGAGREPLARVRIRGGVGPRELLVPLAGHKRLTLVVEPGAGFDVGDHVDWGDARLILAGAAR